MTKQSRLPARFAADDRGATAIEYGLIATAVFLAIVAPMVTVRSNMAATYGDILGYFDAVL